MQRKLFLIPMLSLCSCMGEDRPTSFQGEPIVKGGDPHAVVLTIDDPAYPAVLLTYEKGAVGIGIFQPRTGSPVLTLRDDNNDGVFDLLTYTALSDTGEALIEVVDYGMDGQPDFILNLRESNATVYVDGTWHPVAGVGTDDVTVEINGQIRSLVEVVPKLREYSP